MSGSSNCPECGHNTIAGEVHSDGSGSVYCERDSCEFTDKFVPEEKQQP